MASDIQANTYGLTLNGFVIKPLSQILSELEAAAQSIWGPNIDLGPDGPVGQMIGNDALKVYNLWESSRLSGRASTPTAPMASRLTGWLRW